MRLINRLRPVPLESLDSLLQRLRWANHYQEQNWLHALLPGRPARLNLLRRTSQYAALSELTGLSVETLVSLTLHRFTPWYCSAATVSFAGVPSDGALPIPLWPLQGWRADRSGGPGVVCPRCWRRCAPQSGRRDEPS